MDPATIVGLIASVVTIVEFTTDVVRESHQLVQSGRKPTSLRIAEVVKCQQDACERLLADIAKDEAIEGQRAAESIAQGRPDQVELEHFPLLSQLAKGCVEEASHLTKTLNSLAVRPRDDGTMSFGSALWSVARARVKKKDIEEAQRKLQANVGSLLLHTISRAQKKNATTTESLIQKLSGGQTSNLEKAVADLKATGAASAVEQKNLLTNLQKSFGEQHGKVAVAGLEDTAGRLDQQKALAEVEACKRILESLDFPERTRRYTAIEDAHHKTFGWMYETGSSPIQDWAQSSRGVFWINGKAGSGKSTLMKYIAGNSNTKALLRGWALQDSKTPASTPDTSDIPRVGNTQQPRLTVVEIYFWFLGTELQKSEEGLLRSMLYQILLDSRELLPIACPQRWASVKRAAQVSSIRETASHIEAAGVPWTCSELRASLERIADCTSNNRFAFLIDGLDHYDADQTALVKLIQKLARNPDFKFCVSSRPWNVFVNAFASQQDMFVLEDLTRNDIWKYAHAELTRSSEWRFMPSKVVSDLSANHAPMLKLLCNEVVERAQGVFLWVFLAVRSLREGLEENDDISILRRRLDELPSDLEDYFDVILSRVHKVYRSLTATALYMIHRAFQIQRQNTPWRLTEGHHRTFLNIWLLKQGIESEDFALRQDIVDVDVQRCHEMVLETRRFISACCKDLLCVPKPRPAGKGDGQTYITQYKVDFLHRTVFEYLDEPRILRRLQSSAIQHVVSPRFDVMGALARLSFVPMHSAGSLYFLKEVLQGFEESGPHDLVIYQRLDRVAAHYVKSCASSESRLQDLPKDILESRWTPIGSHSTSSRPTGSLLRDLASRRQFIFLTTLIRIDPVIVQHDELVSDRRPLLHQALGYNPDDPDKINRLDEIHTDCVLAYLESMESFSKLDPCMMALRDRLLYDWYRITREDQSFDATEVWSVMKLLIQPQFENVSRPVPTIEGFPSMIKVLHEVVPATHRHELSDVLAGKRLDTEQRHPVLVGDQMRAPVPEQTRQETQATKTKVAIPVRAPEQLTAEESEAYYQRTGYRP